MPDLIVMTVQSFIFINREIQMNFFLFLQRAAIGAAGMAVGAALITSIRIAAIDGAETARLRHLADIASGRSPTPRVVVRSDLLCPNLAAVGTPFR